ncbi:hypothetical protein H9Q08_11330 [Chryseobacterium sp. PS-8]|uniref:Baseplate protein J-like domain-containing protein n=1 Tax=Chryseobacterium indicum TaxID=2766954 RepID=A0ABS9C985_9FLAO|nr:hypothetical protein [Chryseobacterium sp. PS-8]MCF2219901.1 hypothetical protein [Chryseobacterium sp. PS-8]
MSIHLGMGTTQDGRFLSALQTNYFLLEEREEVDYVLLAKKMSHYITFFNDRNEKNGDWSPFFAWESTAILAQIYKWNIKSYEENYTNIRKTLLLLNDSKEQKKTIVEIFENLQHECTNLIEKVSTLDDAIKVKEFLQNHSSTIEKQIQDILDKINEQNENSVVDLIQDYQFNKSVQQLFGLLLYWKNSTEEPLVQQLESYPAHSPHYALFLAFLKLLGIAKKHLNEFTQRHLDFYYKDILQLVSQKAQPDYVHLLVEPFSQASSFLLPEKTIFMAGKNSVGKNKFYASTSDQVINSIKIKSFLSHHIENSVWKKTNLLALNATNTPFSVFPSSTENTTTGLLIASPLFYMKGGTRTITLKFDSLTLNPNSFDFWITGEKKWIEITQKELTQDKKIQLSIPASEKAIVPFNTKIHDGDTINTSHPILKIIPKNNTENIVTENLEIKVEVKGLKNFIISTDTGAVDINKPFKPFGDFPKNGNGFIIGCNEFFLKKGAIATFSIEGDVTVVNSSLLYEMTGGKFIIKQNTLFNSTYTNNNPVKEYTEDAIPDKESVSGYIRIQLNDSNYEKEKFLEKYIAIAKSLTLSPPATATPLPSAPVIQSIVMNYSATQNYVFESSDKNLTSIEYYHLLPFGFQKIDPANTLSLLPSFPEQGEIFIGLENAQKGNALSLLFQLAEGTANPRKEPAKISWEYLSNNEWKLIDSHDIGDETLGLLQSGIVKITIPEFNASETTLLPNSLFWIKISVNGLDRICNCIGIHEQALKAVLVDFENIGNSFLEITPPKTISKLYNSHPSVKEIKQPYYSFGGKKQEDDSLLYQRSSERLRHKQKSITSWDYERIILQEFPEVYRIKCLNHYRYDTKTVSNVSAGYVTLIPIAKSSTTSTIWEWKPLLNVSTLQKIKNRVMELCSPHVRLCVKPPVLEKIQVECKVKYKEILGADTRLYADIIKEAINRYISPWAYENSEVNFAKKIELSSLIQLIDNQKFVDYVVDFKVNQMILNDTENTIKRTLSDVKEIVPETDYTLFIPNDVHVIGEIKNNC